MTDGPELHARKQVRTLMKGDRDGIGRGYLEQTWRFCKVNEQKVEEDDVCTWPLINQLVQQEELSPMWIVSLESKVSGHTLRLQKSALKGMGVNSPGNQAVKNQRTFHRKHEKE